MTKLLTRKEIIDGFAAKGWYTDGDNHAPDYIKFLKLENVGQDEFSINFKTYKIEIIIDSNTNEISIMGNAKLEDMSLFVTYAKDLFEFSDCFYCKKTFLKAHLYNISKKALLLLCKDCASCRREA